MSGVSKNEDFGRDLGLVHETIVTGRKAGWTRATWVKMQANENLCRDILALVEGRAQLAEVMPVRKPKTPTQRQQLINFYQTLLGLGTQARTALKGVKLETHTDGLNTHMVMLPGLTRQTAMEAICRHFKITAPYMYKGWDKIDQSQQGARPTGAYVFRHAGTDEPDQLNKSYDDAKASGKPFLNDLEYLMSTAFHRFIHGHFMDKSTWTRTDTRWPVGCIVSACWYDDRLCWRHGYRDYRRSGGGSRSAVLLSEL